MWSPKTLASALDVRIAAASTSSVQTTQLGWNSWLTLPPSVAPVSSVHPDSTLRPAEFYRIGDMSPQRSERC